MLLTLHQDFKFQYLTKRLGTVLKLLKEMVAKWRENKSKWSKEALLHLVEWTLLLETQRLKWAWQLNQQTQVLTCKIKLKVVEAMSLNLI